MGLAFAVIFDSDDFLITCCKYPFGMCPFTAEAKFSWEYLRAEKLLLVLLELFDSLELFFLFKPGLNDEEFAYGLLNTGLAGAASGLGLTNTLNFVFFVAFGESVSWKTVENDFGVPNMSISSFFSRGFGVCSIFGSFKLGNSTPDTTVV